MNCSVGNSKSQLHKARMKLRDRLRLHRNLGAAAGSPSLDEQVEEV